MVPRPPIVPEQGPDPEVCIEVVEGSLPVGGTATVTLVTSDGTAQRKETKHSSAIVCTEDHSLNVYVIILPPCRTW